jgi:hypothetical protein
VLFLGVFSWLAARFDYPDVLDRPAAEVLPRLLALGNEGRAVWSLYALIPFLLVPAGIGAARAFGGAAVVGSAFATVSAFAMMLGLARWPTIQWELARAYGPDTRAAIDPLFAGLNVYLGNFVGEFVGELALNLFFATTAWAMLGAPGRPRWQGVAGLVVAFLGFVAMFRNVTPAVGPIAEVNNYVLPLWLIVFGVLLVRWREA